MFAVLGLVLGSIIGLITSFLRHKFFSGLVVAGTILGVIIVLFDLAAIFITKGSGGGDAWMAFATIVVLSVLALAGLLALGLVIGWLLSRINGEKPFANARTILADVFLLSVASFVVQATVIGAIRNDVTPNLESKKTATSEQADRLLASLPPPYNTMSPDTVRDMEHKADERERRGYEDTHRPPANVIQTMNEIRRLRAVPVASRPLEAYTRENSARAAFGWSLPIGWIVSVLAVPILLKKRP